MPGTPQDGAQTPRRQCNKSCGKEIYLQYDAAKKKWLPRNVDGSFHDCATKQQSSSQGPAEKSSGGTRLDAYYGSVKQFDECDLAGANKHLVEGGWICEKIVESVNSTIVAGLSGPQVETSTRIIYVMGKRAA